MAIKQPNAGTAHKILGGIAACLKTTWGLVAGIILRFTEQPAKVIYCVCLYRAGANKSDKQFFCP